VKLVRVAVTIGIGIVPLRVELMMPVLSGTSSSMSPPMRVPFTTVRNSLARGWECGTLRPQASMKTIAALTVI